MSWWGKIIGGTFGFMMGGPLGAMLGGALGHQFDRGLSDHSSGGVGGQERVQTAFFTATFSVMGHVAKADGTVSGSEIALARHVMAQMQLNETQRLAAMRLFEEGKRSSFPLDEVLEQFRFECHRRTTLIRMFLEIQIQSALADGTLHAAERQLLAKVAEALGIPKGTFEQILNMIQGAAHGGGPAGRGPSLADDYKVIGVKKSATDAEVKKAYRRLISQHHPDKLVAKGLPEEMVKLATDKTQQIRAAYERIMTSRGSHH